MNFNPAVTCYMLFKTLYELLKINLKNPLWSFSSTYFNVGVVQYKCGGPLCTLKWNKSFNSYY